MLAWPYVKFSILTFFCWHFSLITFSRSRWADWDNFFVAQWDIVPMWHCPYVPHYMIMILIASFDISYPNLFISPEYYFDSIVLSSFYRLVATYFLFVPCSQKYTYLPVCICSPLLTCSPNAPNLSSQCAPGIGHIGTVEIHFSKVLTPTIFAQ